MHHQPLMNHTGGWNSLNLLQNNVIFSICIIATILHVHTWFQLVIQKTKFDLSFIFPLGYMLTDVILLLFYFIQYSIRIRPWIPVTTWFCCFEAYGVFYVNLFEPYALTALNICRYWQVVRNQNIYTLHRRKLLLIVILLPFLVLLNLIIQHIFGWCIVIEIEGNSCSLTYTNASVQVWNFLIILVMPVVVSFSMLIRILHSLQRVHAQQAIMRRNHHRQLMIHSLIFYTIWLILWLPLMVVTILNANLVNDWVAFAALVASTIETCIDPVISYFLDTRFAQAWKKLYRWVVNLLN